MIHPIRDSIKAFKDALTKSLVEDHGIDADTAATAVGHLGDGRILAWLITHGPQIASLVKIVLAGFGVPVPVTEPLPPQPAQPAPAA